MLTYRFYLRNNQDASPAYVEVDEPIGWDSVSFTLQRSDQFDGIENIYSDDLTFYDTATDILRTAFDAAGFDALLDFKIEFYCNNTLNTTIEQVVNMLTYKRVGNETTVKMEQSSFDRKFKNRYETKVNFNDLLSVEGNKLTELNPFDLRLHSKLIHYTSLMNELGDPIITPPTNSHQPIFIETSGDMPGIHDITSSTWPGLMDNYIFVNATKFNRQLDITIRIRLNSFAHITTNDSGIPEYYYSGGYDIKYFITDNLGAVITSGILHSVAATNSMVGLVNDFTETLSYNFHQDNRLYIQYLDTHEATLPGDVIGRDTSYTYLPQTQIDLSEDSRVSASSSNAYYIYEAFNRICESITDTQNAFRSNFFGRINSAPQTYDTTGCAGWTSVTNGLNIRKMLDKEGNLFPFSSSFYDLFRSCNAIWNLGARIEQDDDGNYYIRVEPKEYFYDNSEEIFAIDQASDIETTVAIDKLYNDIEIGYEKYEIDNVNGIDEFNTKHFYSVPTVNVKKKLEAGGGNGVLSPFVGGGYAIEMTRRKQYDSNPTTDWTYDNDNFIICLNQIEVTSDKYTSPAVSTTYEPGQVAERDEMYSSVTNLISPETAYNLRISPANMMFNWFKSVAPALILKTDKSIKYRYGFSNVLMTSERVDECSIASGAITENQNIGVESTKYTDILSIALFTPVYINFVYPIDFGNFITIKEGSNKLIRVECGDDTYFGFIKELKFFPNDGSATFKILLTSCVGGGFDSGFSSGFETGTC